MVSGEIIIIMAGEEWLLTLKEYNDWIVIQVYYIGEQCMLGQFLVLI